MKVPLPDPCDLLILGAGAAGLVAAAFAARAGVQTLVVEKGPQTGTKILITGGGHCNFTNDCSVRDMLKAYGPARTFLTPSMKAFSPTAVRRHFHRLHVPSRVDEQGKVWPLSLRARDVRDALENDVRAAGARILLGTQGRSVEREKGGFILDTGRGIIRCRRFLITSGGRSYPGTGSTGDGYALAASLGHGLVEPVPALVPLVVETAWVRDLAGISLPEVNIRFLGALEEEIGTSRGPLLFTHTGFSGPAALDLGGKVARHGKRGILEMDWVPELPEDILDRWMTEAHTRGSRTMKRLLADRVPERLATALCQVAAVPPDRQAAQLQVKERRTLIAALKACRIEVAGTLGFSRAEVTAGGIPLNEVDPDTMASRLTPGLFLAGEVLDYDGLLGGYNLQAAFCTGRAAGVNAVKHGKQ